MLFSQAVCGSCGGAFASGVVLAERHGDPVSYRGTAGPCPRCGGRGRIPSWIFSFHAAAAAARDQASAAENSAVLRAARRCAEHEPASRAVRGFAAELTGAWRGVAVQVGRIPPGECDAALAMLGRMLEDRVEPDHAAPSADLSRGATTSAGLGTHGAGQTPMSA